MDRRRGDISGKYSGCKRLFPTATDKSKKGRIKSLSVVNSRSSKGEKEMAGGHVTYGPTQIKREVEEGGEENKKKKKKRILKLPRKRLADDSSPSAYCSSVPRKLRSAMRKRNGESISEAFLGSKKLSGVGGGLKLSERDGGKKSELNVNPYCIPRHCLHGPITKDEEEVVEALYALAGIFNRKVERNKQSRVDDASLSPSVPPQQSDALSQALEVINEETRVCLVSQPAQDAERAFKEIANNHFPKQALTNAVESEKLNKETDNLLSQVTSGIRQSELDEQKPFCCYSTPRILQQTNKDLDAKNLEHDSKLGIVLPDGKPDIALGLSTRTAPQVDFQNTANRTEKDALWPGLDSIAVDGGASSTRSFPAKLPPWLDAALCAKKPSSLQDCSIDKVPNVKHDQKSKKRCATHLYISHLIQGMQLPTGKDSIPFIPDQPKPRELLNRGILLSMNDIHGIRGGLRGTRSNRDPETARCTPEHRKHFPDQIRGTVTLGTRSSEKQTFNSLSLSTDGGGMEAGYIKGVKNEVQTSKSQPIAPPNSRTQQSTVMAFSLSHSYHPSPAYLHQPPTSSAHGLLAQLQPPAHVSHSVGLSHANTNLLMKQHNEQRKQQELQHQQRSWAAHNAAQYRVTEASTSMTRYQYHQYHGSQYETPKSSMTMPNCVKPGAGPASSFAIEALSSNPWISQHQQQAATVASSLPRSIIRKRDHLSSVFDDNGGFRAGTSLRFQLICNDRP